MIPVQFRTLLAVCLALLATTLYGAAAHAAEGAADSDVFTGGVLETMDVAGYTYVKLDSPNGPLWAALPESEVNVGDTISIEPGMEMKDFHSNALDRTFPTIFFSPGIVGSASLNPHQTVPAKEKKEEDPFAAAIAAERQSSVPKEIQPAQSSGGSLGAIVPFHEITVEKATGDNAYTIGEIFARASELDGQTVRVKGQVVKFNSNIMGRNWIHLQDGTGDPMENTHDLVATTTEEVNSPDIVTIEGKLAANKDFGAGYTYQVIIEDGTISK